MTVTDVPHAVLPRFEWPCRSCAPHVGRLATRSWLVVIGVHGVECDLPVEERTTVVLRIPRGQEAGQVGSGRSPRVPVRPAGRPDRASSGLVDDAQHDPPGRLPGRGATSPLVGPPVSRKSTTPTGLSPEFAARGPMGDGTTEGA